MEALQNMCRRSEKGFLQVLQTLGGESAGEAAEISKTAELS